MVARKSKIEKLVAKLCPNGVEFKDLGEVAKIGTGSTNGNEAIEGGQYPLYVRSKTIKFIDSYEFDEEAIIIPGEGSVGEIFHYVNGKYALHQRAYRISLERKDINTKFVYYYFFANFLPYILKKSVNATVMSIRKPMIEKFQVPVPPIEVQEEIVKILDSFTQLEAELEAELEARGKQYEYYRSELLHLDSARGARLSDIVSYSNTRIQSTKLTSENYIGVDNLLPNKQGKTLSNYVPTFGNLTEYQVGDILIGNIRPYLKKIWKATNRGGTNGDVLVLRIKEENRSSISPSYLYHLLSSDAFFEYEMQNAKGAKMPRGDKSAIMRYEIRIPDLTDQDYVVSILDKFDALVNDISVGLPVEIAARRKQYEYYRNKLLTFTPLISH